MGQRSHDRCLLAHAFRKSPDRFVSILPAPKQFQIFPNLRLRVLFRKTVQPRKKKEVLPCGELLVQAGRFREKTDPAAQLI